METLFNVKINWFAYFGFLVAILLLFPGISMFSIIAIMIASHQFLLVFYSIGYIIPVRYLAGSLMSLQMLVGPTLAYNGLDKFQYLKYKMQVTEDIYFSYAIPAVICFIIGLHLFSKLRGEKIDQASIKLFVRQNPRLMYYFIGIGFCASYVAGFFGAELGFVFYLIAGFKFVGAFILIIGSQRLKPAPLILVFGSIVLSSLGSAMFHDLITWLVFILAVFAIKYRPSVGAKIAATVAFLIMIVVIQQLKTIYRQATQFQGKRGDIAAFDDALDDAQSEGSLFDPESLARSNVRINQGFIVTYILKRIPAQEPFSNGKELYQILEAAFLPRILAPNKLKAGDNSLVYKYSGIVLRKHTSMSLSSMGDAYINFGAFGGSIFMMVLGLMFNIVLVGFERYGRKMPIALLFTPLVFYFPIRPDTALQTSLGHLVKACFLLWVVFRYWRYMLTLRRMKMPQIMQPSA